MKFLPNISPSYHKQKPQYIDIQYIAEKINGGQGGIIFIDYKYTYEYNVQLFVQFISFTAEPNR